MSLSTIFEVAAMCRQTLTKCRDVPKLKDEEWAESRLADFNLWASGIGALAPHKASLDHRLALRPDIGNVIKGLLQILHTELEECIDLAEVEAPEILPYESLNERTRPVEQENRGRKCTSPPADASSRSFSPWSDTSESSLTTDFDTDSQLLPLHKAMTSVDSILDQLVRISVVIRRAGNKSRLQKADRIFKRHEHEELRDHLITLITLSKARASGEHCAWPLKIDESRLDEVQVRLLDNNLRRRNRFLYAQRHSQGLGKMPPTQFATQHSKGDVTVEEQSGNIVLQGSVQECTAETAETASSSQDDRSPGQTAKTDTSASKIDDLPSLPQTPGIFSAASTQMTLTATKIHYPYPPKTKEDALFFKCPCCCQTLPIMWSKGNRWIKHLVDDLRPYTCVLPNCLTPEVLFASKEEWKTHLLKDHRSVEFWVCFACPGGTKYQDESAFIAHVQASHYDTIPADKIESLQVISKRSVPETMECCPLCDWPSPQDSDVDREALVDHIAEEVHSFSLISLPWAPDDLFESNERIQYSVATVQDWLMKSGQPSVAAQSMTPLTNSSKKSPRHYFDLNPYFSEPEGRSSSFDDHSNKTIEDELAKESDEDLEGKPELLDWESDNSRVSRHSGVIAANSDPSEEEEPHLEKSPVVDQAELLARKNQGLSDPRVRHVRDRGNAFYYRDHARTAPSSAHFRPPKAEANALAAIVADFEECYLEPEAHPHMFFVPRNDIERIMSPARVRGVVDDSLPGCGDWHAAKRERFTKEIFLGRGNLCKNPCVNLLAAAIGGEAEEYFLPLVERHIDDLCLPLETQNGAHGCVIKCDAKHKHDSIDISHLKTRRAFCLWTHALSSPYFKVEEGRHHHYYLNRKDVLPIEIEPAQPAANIPEIQQHLRDEVQQFRAGGVGGFAKVRMVQFHPAHLKIEISAKNNQEAHNGVYALKCLNEPDRDAFDQELASLLSCQNNKGLHLIRLLFTFEIKKDNGEDAFYFVFPWAQGNLWEFWKQNESQRLQLCPWMADQCLYLTEAIKFVHNERTEELERRGHSEVERELYGRHGDIKGENIVFFQHEDHIKLFITDFGLGQLHSRVSRSISNPRATQMTATYRAPEFDLPLGKISRACDIFSLGCVFLEFVTWQLEGYTSAHDVFPEARLEADVNQIMSDTFFRIEKNEAIVKPKVSDWVRMLLRNPRCSHYHKDFLNLIEEKMLTPSAKDRIRSDMLVERLRVLSKACRTDPSYWKDPLPAQERQSLT